MDLSCLSQVLVRAHFFYDIGLYDKAAKYLKYFVYLYPPNVNNNIFKDKGCIALWGLLADNILCGNYKSAVEQFKQLKETIDGRLRDPNPQEILEERVFLLHWGLFLYFSDPSSDQNLFAELCLNLNTNNKDDYISALQTCSPWLLRYLTCAVMMESKRYRTAHLKELAKVLKIEQDKYSDPITEFISSLIITVDFDKSQDTLAECESVVVSDFFLSLHPEFVNVYYYYIIVIYG